MRSFLLSILICSLTIAPVEALTYLSPSGYTKAVNPGKACVRRSFDVWTRKRYQSFQIKMYPRKLLLPCRRGVPVAIISGWFESFKLSGDRSEACWGKFTLWFTNYGRDAKITWQFKGTLRGMYCRDKGTRTLSLRVR